MTRHAVVIVRVVLAITLGLALVGPLPALAAGPTLEQVSARAVLGEPVVLSATVVADARPRTVEVLVRFPADPATHILAATLAGGSRRWTASATIEDYLAPNTRLDYQFRVTASDGTVALSAPASATVTDDRFLWQTITGTVVRLHWYSGNQAFAQRALDIGQTAISHASELLGVTESQPIDFFIYSDESSFRAALGPGTRENVGGEAHSDIRTMFALITPSEVNADWVDSVVTHELTHLVFNTATNNLYHLPPRWLNEGIAVYLSDGYDDSWRSVVRNAARRQALIPLDGLAGLFPTSYSSFSLAYGESVSAIDYFIGQYGEQTLWDLVRSYANGVSDDDAFRAATGDDLAAFNAAWMASLGAVVPQPYGPQPAPAGPVPVDWQAHPSPGASGPPAPATPSARPTQPARPGSGSTDPLTTLVGLWVIISFVVGVVVSIAVLFGRRRGPPPGKAWWEI
jgi:hypothetical protein